MAKKDIGKILTGGSPKQRLLLLAEDNARAKYSQERLLTESEANQIVKSLKKPNEIKLWNKWIKVDRAVGLATTNLQALKFNVLVDRSNLRGYILLWETLQQTEVLSNYILHEIKDTEERKKIAKKTSEHSFFLLSEIDVDTEGYLGMVVEGDDNRPEPYKKPLLLDATRNVINQVISSTITFISYAKAILDYMEEEGFIIKTYKDMVLSFTEDIHKPILGWDKYEPGSVIAEDKTYNTRVDKIKAQFAIVPNTRELEVDVDIYNKFKSEYLRDE